MILEKWYNYRGNAMLRFGYNIISIASLTFVMFPAQAKQPQQGIRIEVQSTIIASCITDCQSRLYQCISAKTDRNICYYNYNLCTSRCNGTAWYSYLKSGCFVAKES
jgi:hypothetical protein